MPYPYRLGRGSPLYPLPVISTGLGSGEQAFDGWVNECRFAFNLMQE